MLKQGRKVIVIDPNKCTGCHSCELACSIKHFAKCSPLLSRIRIQEFRDVNTYIPITCLGCEDAPCIKVCPMGARVRLESGAVVTNEDACIGCRACIYTCPFGAPVVNPESGKTMSCDLCNDDEMGPWCVKACTMQGALQFVDIEKCARNAGQDFAFTLKEEYKPTVVQEEKGFSVGFG
ncbi:MAG: 4Fe-4S dicluster domain-containing protein [Dehalococcoidia bacterium]|nr:4Fe-4S dicluster domain-containing protein [Dehalococcoidia bacterium]